MLGKEQKKYLRKLAHDRKAIIWIGQAGLSEAVAEEIDIALEHHELVKIKIRAADKEGKNNIADQLQASLGCEMVQLIGNVLTVYRRKRQNPVIKLPAD